MCPPSSVLQNTCQVWDRVILNETNGWCLGLHEHHSHPILSFAVWRIKKPTAAATTTKSLPEKNPDLKHHAGCLEQTLPDAEMRAGVSLVCNSLCFHRQSLMLPALFTSASSGRSAWEAHQGGRSRTGALGKGDAAQRGGEFTEPASGQPGGWDLCTP